jgi:hypothetical protein
MFFVQHANCLHFYTRKPYPTKTKTKTQIQIFFMKTNGIANPAQPGKKLIQTSRSEKPVAKQQISDRAFYLIALATLLQETAKPGTMQELLAPAKFSGYRQPDHH